MSNNNPQTEQLYKQKAKWKTATGATIDCKTIRVPVYLADEILQMAYQLHLERIGQTQNEEAA